MKLEPFQIDPATRLGPVNLKVADLERQLTFYQQIIGMRQHWRRGAQAGLGVRGADLLRLREIEAGMKIPGTTGLYHYAILLPSRKELARAIARLFSLRYRNYPTDHVMTKTTYLDDPEGNGIELYADTPEDGTFGIEDGRPFARRNSGEISDGREPLDLEALFAELTPDDRLDEPMPAGTKIGHVHLHVADVGAAMRFYRDLLGFDDMGSSAAYRFGFVSAGGYHHHIGLNTWAGEGAPPPPADAPGLDHFSVVVPDRGELFRIKERIKNAGIALEELDQGFLVHDPSQNGIRIEFEINIQTAEV